MINGCRPGTEEMSTNIPMAWCSYVPNSTQLIQRGLRIVPFVTVLALDDGVGLGSIAFRAINILMIEAANNHSAQENTVNWWKVSL